MTTSPQNDPVSAQRRRGFWLRQLHQWHWISSAVCLVAMLLFTATGITLNHAAKIEAQPRVDNRTVELPAALLEQLAAAPQEGDAPLPEAVAATGTSSKGSCTGGSSAHAPATSPTKPNNIHCVRFIEAIPWIYVRKSL